MKSKSTLLILLFLAGFIHAQENYNLQMRGNLPFPGRELANIGGYVDSLGNEYALVGTNTGLSIVNVTDSDKPGNAFASLSYSSQGQASGVLVRRVLSA